MKRLAILMTVTLFTIATTLNAQSSDYRYVATADAGASLIGFSFNAADLIGDVNASSTPVFQGGIDVGLAPWFSLGLAGSFQSFQATYNNYSYQDSLDNTIVENFNLDASRLNVGIRALFHYANRGKLDMYSGLRIGFSFWRVDIGTTDLNFDDFPAVDFLINNGADNLSSLSGMISAPALIPFGMRYYFTDNIGAGFETQLGNIVGSPYFISAGIRARF